MKKIRSRKWAAVFGSTLILSAGQASIDGLATWANESPGGSGGEVNLDFLHPPGPDGSGHQGGSGNGPTDGIRPGADPNDFSVSSPRKPLVLTTPVPERHDQNWGSAFHVWLQTLVSRLSGMLRRG